MFQLFFFNDFLTIFQASFASFANLFCIFLQTQYIFKSLVELQSYYT